MRFFSSWPTHKVRFLRRTHYRMKNCARCNSGAHEGETQQLLRKWHNHRGRLPFYSRQFRALFIPATALLPTRKSSVLSQMHRGRACACYFDEKIIARPPLVPRVWTFILLVSSSSRFSASPFFRASEWTTVTIADATMTFPKAHAPSHLTADEDEGGLLRNYRCG